MVQIRQGTWDNKKIALLTAHPESFSEEIISRLARRNWQVGVNTPKIGVAFKAINCGTCSLLIIHDTKELPASFALRAQIVDPIAILTPTIVVTHPEHQTEAELLKDIGNPILVENGANPADFIGKFEWMLRRWGQGHHQQLFQARKMYADQQFLPFSNLITTLKEDPELQSLITPCMAQLLMKQSNFKTVEKLLLAALKGNPRNIGIIINLVEFYLRAVMPETALKIIAATRKNHGSPRILFSDQIQAHLMLNQTKECIPLLESLVRENYCREQATHFLARCLYAEGYIERFQQITSHQIPVIEEFRNRWQKAAG